METKTCKDCGETKPWNKLAPRESEANGWIGMFCFACYTIRRRVKCTGSAELITAPHAKRYAHFQPIECSHDHKQAKYCRSRQYYYRWVWIGEDSTL